MTEEKLKILAVRCIESYLAPALFLQQNQEIHRQNSQDTLSAVYNKPLSSVKEKFAFALNPAQQVLPFPWNYNKMHNKIMRLRPTVEETEPSQLQWSCSYSNHFGWHGPQGTIVIQLMQSTFKCRGFFSFFWAHRKKKIQLLYISKSSLKSKTFSLWGDFSHFQNQAFSSKLF